MRSYKKSYCQAFDKLIWNKQ